MDHIIIDDINISYSRPRDKPLWHTFRIWSERNGQCSLVSFVVYFLCLPAAVMKWFLRSNKNTTRVAWLWHHHMVGAAVLHGVREGSGIRPRNILIVLRSAPIGYCRMRPQTPWGESKVNIRFLPSLPLIRFLLEDDLRGSKTWLLIGSFIRNSVTNEIKTHQLGTDSHPPWPPTSPPWCLR